MRHWREREFERHLSPATVRAGLGLWAFVACRPKLYHFVTGLQARVLGRLGRARGRFDALPLARGWTRYRDFPAPEGRTFQQLWAERRNGKDQGSARP
jgi:L-lactate dehydrogenase complex protein LldF